MKIYHYNSITKLYSHESEARTFQKDKTRFVIPANATSVSPFNFGLKENQCYKFDEASKLWEVTDDFRNFTYYDLESKLMITIMEIGIRPPDNYAPSAPPANIYKPEWNGTEWIETSLLYKNQPVETKSDVDNVTMNLISKLGEDKAKTEKLIAGDNPCPIWDAFVIARQTLIDEGNTFVLENHLV